MPVKDSNQSNLQLAYKFANYVRPTAFPIILYLLNSVRPTGRDINMCMFLQHC
jgi:hypothetical protein